MKQNLLRGIPKVDELLREAPLAALGKTVHRIGGAELAAELDAKRAIDQGTRLAMTL